TLGFGQLFEMPFNDIGKLTRRLGDAQFLLAHNQYNSITLAMQQQLKMGATRTRSIYKQLENKGTPLVATDRAIRVMKAPLLALAACFALGIALARPGPLVAHPTLADPVRAIPVFLGCAAACLLAGLVVLRARWQLVATVLALAGYVLAGAAGMRLFEFRFPPGHVSHLGSYLGTGGLDLSQPVRLDGRLISDPQRTPYGWQFDIEATRLEAEGPR